MANSGNRKPEFCSELVIRFSFDHALEDLGLASRDCASGEFFSAAFSVDAAALLLRGGLVREAGRSAADAHPTSSLPRHQGPDTRKIQDDPGDCMSVLSNRLQML